MKVNDLAQTFSHMISVVSFVSCVLVKEIASEKSLDVSPLEALRYG